MLIYNHKEQTLHEVAWRYPGRHSIRVDDKLSILAAMKKVRADRLAIVFQRLKTLDHITGAIREMQSVGCRFK